MVKTPEIFNKILNEIRYQHGLSKPLTFEDHIIIGILIPNSAWFTYHFIEIMPTYSGKYGNLMVRKYVPSA